MDRALIMNADIDSQVSLMCLKCILCTIENFPQYSAPAGEQKVGQLLFGSDFVRRFFLHTRRPLHDYINFLLRLCIIRTSLVDFLTCLPIDDFHQALVCALRSCVCACACKSDMRLIFIQPILIFQLQ